MANLLVLALAYGLGIRRLWRRAGKGRVITKWRAVCFVLGTLTLGFALLSPVDALSNDLSWVHMCQHMLLMVVAAPLIVAGAPGMVLPWVLPVRWRSPLLRILAGSNNSALAAIYSFFWNPCAIWLLHAIGLWIWHLPKLYQWALHDPLVHDVAHLTFFLVGCLFWRVVVDVRNQRTLPPLLSVFYLFTTSIHTMFLGVFMALAPHVWYPIYAERTLVWGLTALEDQQLAGAIMWMPSCMVYAVVAVIVFAVWMDQSQQT